MEELQDNITVFWLIFAGMVLGIIVGSRGLFCNWIAGMVLRAKHMQPGDLVEFHNGCAWIKSFGAVSLIVQTCDKCHHIVPYHDFMGGIFPSKSYSKRDFILRIPPARKAIKFGRQNPSPVADIGLEPESVLGQCPALGIIEKVTPQGMILRARAWITDPTDGLSNVRSQFVHEVLNRLNAAGFTLTFPIEPDLSLN